VDDQLRALAEPRRRAILHLITDREMAAGEIASHFEVTRPAISQHLSVLKAAGLVTERRDGVRRLYRTDPAGLLAVRQYLDGFWAGRLTRLKAAAQSEGAPSRPRDTPRDGD
jgi:DNA-binding transcriptional ArsR family regulator